MNALCKTGIRICLAAALTGLLSGCMGQLYMAALGSTQDAKIGYHSAPTSVPKIGGVSVEVRPLNNNHYNNPTSFVVCLMMGSTDSNPTYPSISLDASKVVLVRPDGSRVHPQAYAEYRSCPKWSGYSFSPLDTMLEFKTITPGAMASSLATPGGRLLSDIAFRFDVETIDAHQDFSLELVSIDIDGRSHPVAPIRFKKVYGLGNYGSRPFDEREASGLLEMNSRISQRLSELRPLKNRYRFSGVPGREVLKQMANDGFVCQARTVTVLPRYDETTAERIPAPFSFFSCMRSATVADSVCAAYEVRFQVDQQYASTQKFETAFLDGPITSQETDVYCHPGF